VLFLPCPFTSCRTFGFGIISYHTLIAPLVLLILLYYLRYLVRYTTVALFYCFLLVALALLRVLLPVFMYMRMHVEGGGKNGMEIGIWREKEGELVGGDGTGVSCIDSQYLGRHHI